MGGFGSGRWQGHNKAQTVEWCFVLDAAILAGIGPAERRRGTAAMRTRCSARVLEVPWGVIHPAGHELDLWLNGEAYPPGVVDLSARRMRFGGVYWYMHCPQCGRRVRKLYVPLLGRHFLACRRCHGLVYKSSQVHRTVDELFRRGDPGEIREYLAALRARIQQPIDPRMPRPVGARAAREPRPGATKSQ